MYGMYCVIEQRDRELNLNDNMIGQHLYRGGSGSSSGQVQS